jgi:hypothetical protein
MRHRVAFTCDLFMDVDAPAEASTKDLEQEVIKQIRALFDNDKDSNIVHVAIPIGRRTVFQRINPDMVVYLRDGRTPNVIDAMGTADEDVELENFKLVDDDA